MIRKILFFSTFITLAFVCACNKAGTANNANSTPPVNANANVNTNTASTTINNNSTSANLEPGNAAGFPTDVYKAAYMARKNCDVAGLKKVMSKDILKFLGDMGKDEKKSLDDELKEICGRPQNPSQQTRNEKIDGDHASLEYLDEEGNWQRMDFVREGGSWKMSVGGAGQDAPDVKADKDDNRS